MKYRRKEGSKIKTLNLSQQVFHDTGGIGGKMYCGDDDFYNSYYHAAELWKFEPESEEQKEARKKMKEMMKKEREINHESEDEEAYWNGYNDGYEQSTRDSLEHKKKFVPPPTPEEFRSYSHIPLNNIEGT